MTRGLSGFERPPVWAWIVMGLGIVSIVVMVLFPPAHPQPKYEGLTLAQAYPSGAAHEAPWVVVLGDSYSAGSHNTVVWPDLLANARGWHMINLAVGGSGYVSGQRTFPVVAAEVVQKYKPNLVIIAGSRNDKYFVGKLAAAAAQTYSTIASAWPGVPVVVIGPMWDASKPPPDVVAASSEIGQAAQAAGLPYVDAIVENWLSDPAWIQSDGAHPTDTGQHILAQRIGQALDQLKIKPTATPTQGP